MNCQRAAVALFAGICIAIGPGTGAVSEASGAAAEGTATAARVDGRTIPLDGASSVSISAAVGRAGIEVVSEPGKRVRFRLDGVDPGWREGLGDMYFAVHFYDANGEQIDRHAFRLIGQTAGWNGDLQRPRFVHRQEDFSAPSRANSFVIVITSAGPPETLGAALIKGVVVSRATADGIPEVILRAPVGPVTRPNGFPVSAGFCTDGGRPSMATLLTLPLHSPGASAECFAIIDNDVRTHAEWHTLKENATSISPGEELYVEWDEAYSIGLGGSMKTTYENLASGSYRLRVQTVDLLGQPAGPEGSFTIRVVVPWWQQRWAWACGLAVLIAVVVSITRYVAHRRMRHQFERIKEERLIEQERLRIAREIHDTLAQGLTGIIVQLEAAADARSKSVPAEADEHLTRAEHLARESLNEARRSVRALRPQALEEKDLAEALEPLITKMTAGTTVRTEFVLKGTPRKLPSDWEQNLLRILQEVLTNVLRHARAGLFRAEIVFAPDEIRFDMRDDGCGFDPGRKSDGFGLLGIRERAEAMGGRMAIQSAPSKGVAILITLPFAKGASSS
jgi:signal transduction histidine kinase